MTPTNTIEHVSKALLKRLRSLQQKKFRDEEGLFLAEGRKCVEELVKRFELVYLIDSQNATQTDIEQLSSLRTPQGVIGVFRKPAAPTASVADGLVVCLDGIQDPGNLGTIIRTCDWFGVRQVVCSNDTADCFAPKVVQATMGALARVEVVYTDLEAFLGAAPKGLPIYGTLLDGRNLYEPGAIADRERGVIIMGNEGNGISAAVRSYITHPLLIPSYPTGVATSESLNVSIATAVTLAEFRRD